MTCLILVSAFSAFYTVWESTVKNGQQAKTKWEIKLLIKKRKKKKARSHSIHWWLSRQRPVISVKHGVTTIHADSAASDMVSTFCLTTEVETVNSKGWAASRGDSQTTPVIIITDSMSLLLNVKRTMGSPGWLVSMLRTQNEGQLNKLDFVVFWSCSLFCCFSLFFFFF